ncbi:MAG: hypothetical protein EOM37_01050 [Proteobacteria bacterium]|jgi:predicted Zn finger-like uncharacterized protein|nr:zinc-ribbon domain-containing protein [Alphaproteobacteria bacterium]NCC02628.1 hypothetical protein [Pseudomonadota bacterium]
MIVVCPKCKASFLVPATTFKNGGCTVRCAKCKWVWHQRQSGQHKPVSPPPTPAQQKEPPTAKQTKVDKTPTIVIIEEAPPKLRFTKERLLNLMGVALTICGAFVLFILSVIYVAHGPIVRTWPAAQSFYSSMGWVKAISSDQLTLSRITSQRRYMDGAMHLVINGVIISKAEKVQVIPDINIDAVAPDGQIIQSWLIKPPKATLEPDEAVPFTSSIVSPERTVIEVNLNFVELSHDKK